MKRMTLSDAGCLVAAAILLYMSALSAVSTERAGYELWTGVLCAGLCLAPVLFHHAGVMTLPLAFVALMLAAIFLHGYGVLLMKYDDLVWYDAVTHTASTITVGLCVFYALVIIEHLDHKTSFGSRVPLLLTLIMMTFSIYWEVLELVVDTIWATNMQYSPWDTVRDLVCNSAGTLWITALAILAIFYLRLRIDEDFIDRLELHPSLHRFATRPSERLAVRKRPETPDLPGAASEAEGE